ncbi:hypothetical protein PENSTE_c007G03904 [Penicillium steckii]|uniref:Uncharacterized protein n=1 Tax=Penicillium steckii TaxID=303698 RepID=A0A1V6TDD5_9EURO|nr:hypothetical protein PENSTE_c007G03904 [Penicillium steckii]
MHGVLALSALHLSRKDPHSSRRSMNLIAATKHHKEALGLFHKQLANPHSDSAHAMFAFDSIAVAYSFGFLLTPNNPDPIDSIDKIHRVLLLSNSVHQAIRMSQGGCDEMASVSIMKEDEQSTELPKDIALAIDNIRTANTNCAEENPGHETKVYDETINKVTEILCSVYGGTKSSALVCQRVAQLPRRFLALVKERDQMALVILTHMCIPLYHLKHCWYFDEWCTRVANMTWSMLEERWRPFVYQAMTIIFGIENLGNS